MSDNPFAVPVPTVSDNPFLLFLLHRRRLKAISNDFTMAQLRVKLLKALLQEA